MTVKLFQTPDNGGSEVTRYVLEISPYLTSSWTEVDSYNGFDLAHTLTTASGEIAPFQKYRLRMKALNNYGSSDYSQELLMAVAPLPSKPAPPTKD